MSLRSMLLVYSKEMRETLRDRRTLIVMVLLPLSLYPLVGVGMSQWVAVQETSRAEQSCTVGLQGADWPDLEQALRRAKLQPTRGAWASARVREGLLRAGALDVFLELPGDFRERLRNDGTVELRLTHDETRERSVVARDRVHRALTELGAELRDARLAARDLPPSLVEPLRAVERSVASSKEVSAHLLSGVLPLLVILMVLLGAFYPAIDLTAGEKERGTLETLLVTPVERTSIIAGKYLVVATIAAATGLLNLGSIGLTILLGFGPVLRAAGLTSSIPWSSVALSVAAIIPTALFFAAVMTAVAAVARSFKEAQNLLTPVYMGCMLPAMLAQVPGLQLTSLTAVIPVVNVSLLTRELIAGRLAPIPVALALLSTIGYTLIALRVAARIYNSERMLFAVDAPRRQARPPRAIPTPAEAAKLLFVVMVLISFVGQPLQARSVVLGLLVTEWVLLALPVAVLVRRAPLVPATALGLATPRPLALVGAGLAGLSGWYLIGVLVEGLQQRVLPIPRELLEEMQRLLFSADRSLALELFVLAISPAICEELVFRGVLLRASYPALRLPAAALLNGVLFGLFHLSIYRFLPTALLGAALTVITVRAGSIWPGMLFHALNNSSAVLVGRYSRHVERVLSKGGGPLYGALALLVFVAGMALVGLGARREPPAPSSVRSTP
jgi:sodium transport system permease protein